jgi:hypothetical protein
VLVYFSWHQFRHTGSGKVPGRHSSRQPAVWYYSVNSAELEATMVPAVVMVQE